ANSAGSDRPPGKRMDTTCCRPRDACDGAQMGPEPRCSRYLFGDLCCNDASLGMAAGTVHRRNLPTHSLIDLAHLGGGYSAMDAIGDRDESGGHGAHQPGYRSNSL